MRSSEFDSQHHTEVPGMMVCTIVPVLVNFGPVPDPGLQQVHNLLDDKTLVITDLNLVY